MGKTSESIGFSAMIDIKERLRAFDSFAVNPQICKEAADHIATLEASVAANQKDRNFCPRCGKRNYPNSIHTCTPPL
jgi:NADH pyrophosphatase NudC (nudix superfamily)